MGHQTGPLDFGHSWRGVPETLHIGADPRILMRKYGNLATDRFPANRLD